MTIGLCIYLYFYYYRQELRRKREECERFLKVNEKSLVLVDPVNNIDKVTRLILNEQKGTLHF